MTPAVDVTPSVITLSGGNLLYVYLAYDGTTVTETITDTTNGNMFTTTYAKNIPTTVGANTAWVGMTASDSTITMICQFSQFVMEP